jgi:ABC-type transporter Mla subunit MlaD
MPIRKADEFKVGLTVVLILAAFVSVVMILGDWEGLTRTDRNYAIRFPIETDLLGLRAKDPVKLGGALVVGTVRSVSFDAAGGAAGQTIAVGFSLDSDVTLKDDCRITVSASPIGGLSSLNILSPGKEGRPLGDNAAIDGVAPASFNQILTRIDTQMDPMNPHGLVSKLSVQLDPLDQNSIVAGIKRQLNPDDDDAIVAKVGVAMDRLNAAIENVRAASVHLKRELDPDVAETLMAKLNATMDEIQPLAASLRQEFLAPEGEAPSLAKVHSGLDKLNNILESVKEAAAGLHQNVVARLGVQLDAKDPDSLISKIGIGVDRLDESLANVQDTTLEVRDIIALNRINIDRMIENLKVTSDRLKAAGEDLRRNPWKLFYQPGDKETAETLLVDSARGFADAATRLNDVATNLKAISEKQFEGVPIGEDQLADIQAQLQSTFKQFSQAEQKLWEALK